MTPTTTPTLTPPALIIDPLSAESGSLLIRGSSAPDEPLSCIAICADSPNRVPDGCTANDTLLGSGGTDPQGTFIQANGQLGIALSQKLEPGELICAADTCSKQTPTCMQISASTSAPTLSASMLAVAVALLGLIGLRGIGRRRGAG